MITNLKSRFVPIPKHPFDLDSQRKTSQAVNALRNLGIFIGKEAKIHQSDANTLIEIPPATVADPTFYPFKIYKPDFSTLSSTGWTFDALGNPVSIAINSTIPTNLPTTINPTTDGWRIWAIRTGRVSARGSFFVSYDLQFWVPGISGTTIDSSFSVNFEIKDGCDSIGMSWSSGFPYDYNPIGTIAKITPIVLPYFFDASSLYSIALWIKVDFENQSAEIMGTRYQTLAGYGTAFPDPPDSSYIPLGAITSLGPDFYSSGGDPTKLTAYNIREGNIADRYGLFQNNLGNTLLSGLLYSAGLNYRGDFLNDTDMDLNAYYPGDVVKIERQINLTATSTGGINTSVKATDASGSEGNSSSLFAQSLYMMTVAGFTTDPTTDPNWVKITGLDVKTQTDQTPNT